MGTDIETTAKPQVHASHAKYDSVTPAAEATPDAETGNGRIVTGWQRICIYLPVLIAFSICIYFASRVGIMPGSDYWGVIGQLLSADGFHVTLQSIYAQDNEHIIAVPKVIYLANVFLTGGDNRALTIIACLLSLAVGVLLASALTRTLYSRKIDRSAHLLLAVGFIASVAAFTPLAAHNYFVGMSGVAWVSANLLTLAALYVQYRYQTSYKALAVAIVLCLLAAQAYSTGVPALLLLGIQLTLQRNTRQRGFTIVAGGLVVIAIIYLHQSVPAALGPRVFSLRLAFEFVVTFLGGGLTAHFDLAGIWGTLGLLLFSWLSIRTFWRHRSLTRSQAFWVTVGGFIVATATMAAIARVGSFGVAGAVASRYATLPALFWVALLGLSLAVHSSKAQAAYHQHVTAAFMVACTAALTIIVGSHHGVDHFLQRSTYKPGAALSVYLGAQDTALLHDVVTPATAQLTTIRNELIRVQHVPFNGHFDRCPRLGSTITRYASDGPATPKGFVDSGEWLEASSFVKLHGWVANSDGSAYGSLLDKPHCIAIADRTGVVMGLGITRFPRPDVAGFLGSADLNFGWVGYAQVKDATSTLVAYARDKSDGRWYRLGNSLHVTPGKVVSQSTRARADTI